jgi:mono/diheme cytochrome c family protein
MFIDMPRRGIALAAAALVAAVGVRGLAQTPAKPEPLTTRSGVFTTAQATAGEQVFSNTCLGCHTTATYTTPTFLAKWNGQPLSELFGLISETMPEDFPGSLTPKEYTQVLAYLLKLNRMPEGQQELPANVEKLKAIRFEARSR